MNLFRRIVLYFQIHHIFLPYFSSTKKLDTLEKVEDAIDPKIEKLYQEIEELGPTKYIKEKTLYNSYEDTIRLHNEEVDYIDDSLASFNYDEILRNPYLVNDEQKASYQKIIDTINHYKHYSDKYKKFKDELSSLLDDYNEICYEFNLYLEYLKILDFSKEKYINKAIKRNISSKINEILSTLKRKQITYYPFDSNLHIEELVDQHNEFYLREASENPLFDNINNKSLDNEQRRSILIDENSVLVIAGAGSGKTLTICGKVTYLLKEENVNPQDILLLSYSRKSAEDLQSKVHEIDSNLTVGTFHKIGLDILKETQHKKFMIEEQYKAIIESYFREEMFKSYDSLKNILLYYALFMNSSFINKKYNDEGEMLKDLKRNDFETLKNLSEDKHGMQTIKREHVKSYEELAIANWYFINGIDYVYEAPYIKDVSTYEKRQYTPDFMLTKYNIYHEHYGIDKDGTASHLGPVEGKKYVESMKWKRELHKENHTICIETYSYEFKDGTVFDKLEKELKRRGVEFNPLSEEEIANALKSVYLNTSFRSFINLISTFISLYKATYRDDQAFDKFKSFDYKNPFEKYRICLFLDIAKDVYHYYMNCLKAEHKIDFDDMILKSIEELDNTEKFKYKYIIVDEFQDISVSRMKFLKKLISHGNSKLYAVGDDYQAIYRFSGCDLNIFLHFSKYFGDSAITQITSTHRNSQELQNIAVPFIEKNPEQIDKNIRSEKHLEYPIQIMWYSGKKHKAFLDILSIISKKDESANVLVLGRNNRDIEDIELDNRIHLEHKRSKEGKRKIICEAYPKMNITYSTVHGSKGLEEDYVILINADDDLTGFPNKMEDDEVLNLVLSSNSKYEYAEERRLWYVALTRTRSYTYIIANNGYPSQFLKEIEEQCLILNPELSSSNDGPEISCPWCKSGHLVIRERKSDHKEFLGCSNYPYCNYAIDDFDAVLRNKRCPECGDFMIYRETKKGSFFGCRNYPRCKHTENISRK